MTTILFLLVTAYALYAYYHGRKAEVMFCLLVLATNFFLFVDANRLPFNIKYFDLILIVVVAVCGREYVRNKSFFSTKGDIAGKAILAIFIWQTLSLARTILLDIEYTSYAFKIWRGILILLLYFYTRTMTWQQIVKFFSMALTASIVQGVFFYLQLVGVEGILTGRVDEGDVTRLANYPIWAVPLIIYFVVAERLTLHVRIGLALYFGAMLLLGQMRGSIMAIAAALGLYFAMRRKAKYIGYIGVGLAIYHFAVVPMFEYRTRNNETSTMDEIAMVLSDPMAVHSNYIREGGGTFAFRIAVLSERIQYMADNPRYLPFGVGSIHEDSPRNNFFFHLGTSNREARYGYSMLGSADISWVGILMRYGLVGIVLYLLLLYNWGRSGLPGVPSATDPLYVTSSLMVVFIFLTSFDSACLERTPDRLNIIFFLSTIYVYQRRRSLDVQSA